VVKELGNRAKSAEASFPERFNSVGDTNEGIHLVFRQGLACRAECCGIIYKREQAVVWERDVFVPAEWLPCRVHAPAARSLCLLSIIVLRPPRTPFATAQSLAIFIEIHSHDDT